MRCSWICSADRLQATREARQPHTERAAEGTRRTPTQALLGCCPRCAAGSRRPRSQHGRRAAVQTRESLDRRLRTRRIRHGGQSRGRSKSRSAACVARRSRLLSDMLRRCLAAMRSAGCAPLTSVHDVTIIPSATLTVESFVQNAGRQWMAEPVLLRVGCAQSIILRKVDMYRSILRPSVSPALPAPHSPYIQGPPEQEQST